MGGVRGSSGTHNFGGGGKDQLGSGVVGSGVGSSYKRLKKDMVEKTEKIETKKKKEGRKIILLKRWGFSSQKLYASTVI